MALSRTPWYPKATRVDRSAAYPGAALSRAQIVVLHSTEGNGPAAYSGGASAPHLEYNPKTRTWRQFFPLAMSSRALKNAAGGVETNRDPRGVIQVEIVGTSGWSPANGIAVTPLMSALTDAQLGDLAEFLAWMHAHHGTPLTTPMDPWPAWNADDRLAKAEWSALDGGIVGHSMVPENDHTDPGRLDIGRILDFAINGPEEDDDMPYTEADLNRIIQDAVCDALASTRGHTLAAQAAQRSLSGWSRVPEVLSQVAAKQGVAVDQAALAKAVTAGVAAEVRAAVVAAVQAGGEADAIADAVVDRLGAALTTKEA